MQKICSDAQMQGKVTVRGASVYQGFLDRDAQEALVEEVRAIARAAPLHQPVMRSGRKMSVRMTAAGDYGWVSDGTGYRYAPRHPRGHAWPPIPPQLLDLWAQLTGFPRKPECCLVNFYDADARMGLHQDRDEQDFSAPVLSVSLGDDALFRVGKVTRGGKTESIWLSSGDIVVLGGAARMAYHGVDRIRAGSSSLLPNGGRINLTLRVVT